MIRNVREVSDEIAILGGQRKVGDTDNSGRRAHRTEDGRTGENSGGPNGVSSRETLYISYPNITEAMHVGDDILIDDEIDLKVEEIHDDHLICLVTNEGFIGSARANIPG